MQGEIIEQSVAHLSAILVPVLLCEDRRHLQRSDLAVRRPVGHDFQRPAPLLMLRDVTRAVDPRYRVTVLTSFSQEL
jgi:hypothetical protein